MTSSSNWRRARYGSLPRPLARLAQLLDPRQPRFQPRPRIGAQHFRLRRDVARQRRQDRLPRRRGDGTALRHDQGVRDRLGQIGEQLGHDTGRFHPRMRTAARSVLAVDIGRVGDAQHGVMRVAERRFGETARIGGNERQVASKSEVDQRGFGGAFHRVVTAAQLDIQPVGKQARQALEIRGGARRLLLRQQPRQRALAACGQRQQAVGPPRQRGKGDMRRLLDRPVEMRLADQRTQRLIARLVLGIERQPVEHRRRTLGHIGSCHRQHRADDRLHALRARRIGEGHRRI